MLVDFPVAVALGSERYVVICRDVPTAVFFHRYPNVPPGTKCSEKQKPLEQRAEMLRLHGWLLELLTRVTVNPRLTLEMVQRLDFGALEAVFGYCYAVGWFTEAHVKKAASGEGPMGDAARRYWESFGALGEEILPTVAPAPARYADQHTPYVGEVATNIKLAVRKLAAKARVLPSVIWTMPISETMFNYRLLIEEDQKTSGGVGAGASVLTGDDALIGFEDEE